MNIVPENIDYSLHTHSVGFDGHDSVDDMVKAARAKGIKTLGFSNHFIVHPYMKKSPMYNYAKNLGYENIYSDNVDKTIEMFLKHYQEVRNVRQKNPDMDILCGMEMDLFPYSRWSDMAAYAVRILKPDYIIGAVHFLDRGPQGVLNVHDIEFAPGAESRQLLREYYQNVELLTGYNWYSLPFDLNFYAHFNLPRKVGLYFPEMERYIIKSLALNGVPMELNTALMTSAKYGLGNSDAKTVLQDIAKNGANVVVSDDAHSAKNIGAGRTAVLNAADGAGITNICTKSADLSRFIHLKSH